ncbi:MAG: hypothetical protein AAB901_00325 [Patescibacteria group bacterium]
MSANAPQERIELIHAIYGVGKPLEPFVLVNDKQKLFEHLQRKGKHPELWGTDERPGSRSFERLWKEYEEDDSILAIMVQSGEVARFIRTITLRIYRDVRYRDTSDDSLKSRREILREFVTLPGRPERERRYENSASEKMKWQETDRLDAIRRLFWQELERTRLLNEHLQEPLLQEVPSDVMHMKDGQQTTKIDKHPSHAYPGIETYNQLFHYFYRLVKRYWRPSYREVTDEKITEFRWKPEPGVNIKTPIKPPGAH